jgi:hypothetical protein
VEKRSADSTPGSVGPGSAGPGSVVPGVAGSGIVGRFVDMVGRLRHPWIFAITGALFLVDLVIPDLIPFIDEMLLGLATVLLAMWRKRKDDAGRADANHLPGVAESPAPVSPAPVSASELPASASELDE